MLSSLVSFVSCAVLQVLLISTLSTCVPIDGAREPSFVPDPSGRGTLGLVMSCIFTLSLCVWTALHLNVVPKGTSRLKRTLRKTGWALMALFAPEYVLWSAITQWQCARKVCDMRNEILDNQTRSAAGTSPTANTETINASLGDAVGSASSGAMSIHTAESATNVDSVAASCVSGECSKFGPVSKLNSETNLDLEKNKRKRWCLEQGFYAAMGGYVVSVEEQDQWILNDGMTVTLEGILILARLDMLPDIDRSTVTARSKADGLAKTLVVIQASWMIIQIIARRASGLPVTLLELNTLAHVICAMAMYGLWWKKPQDVKEPVEIKLNTEFGAFLSSVRLRRQFEIMEEEQEVPDERSKVWMSLVPNTSQHSVRGIIDDSRHYQSLPNANHYKILEQYCQPDGRVLLFPLQSINGIPLRLQQGRDPIHLTDKDIKRLEILGKLLKPPHVQLSKSFGRVDGRRYLKERASNHCSPGDLKRSKSHEMFAIMAVLGLCYGGVHATSWNGVFPTVIEQTMWRIATCLVAGIGFVLWMLQTMLDLYEKAIGPVPARFVPVVLVFDGIILFLFGSSRLYLVGEAFMSIRSLPLGAYSTVSWANFLPHIG